MRKPNHPSEAVVLIRSREGKVTGTGFAIHQEGNRTWILTCAHVVEDAGGAEILIKFGEEERTAELVEGCCGSSKTIDLAVLQVDTLALPILSLRLDGKTGEDFQIPGFAELDGKYAAEPVKGRLGDQFPVETTR
jgi:S1-C subfamily serine protease